MKDFIDKIQVVDLFSGAGGLSLAAKNCGARLVFAVENDPHAAATYRNNFCQSSQTDGTILYADSILNLEPVTLKNRHFENGIECDLLLGGPPCQGFSTHRIKDAGVNDPRNQLIYSYFEFVNILKPRAFLMENVPGLLWPRHKEFLAEFYSLARNSGYTVLEPTVLDARDFGVPQRRKRVFIVGLRDHDKNTISWPPELTHGPHGNANGLDNWVDCSNIFGDAHPNDPNDIHMNHGAALQEAFKNTPPNGGSRKDSGRVLPCHRSHDGHKDVYGRIDPSCPAPTMTTACINPSKGRFVHPTLHHGITARHAARIQTFPDNFIFSGGLTAAGKQIGNAVPIKLGEVLIKTIIQALESRIIDKELLQATA